MSIRLAIVNDYEVVVRGLETMLTEESDDFAVVELDARTTVAEPVDIALLDTFARVQRQDAVSAAELAANPLVGKVVIYSWDVAAGDLEAVRRREASGYLSKALGGPELAAALVRIQAGEVVVLDVYGDDHHAAVEGDWPGRPEGLAPREASVVALITRGLSNREIAAETGLSRNTVKTYIRSAYAKMGVNSRTQAVLWGIEHGFLPDRRRIKRPGALTH